MAVSNSDSSARRALEAQYRRKGVGTFALFAFLALMIALLVVPYEARWYFYVGLGLATMLVFGMIRFLSSDY